MKNKTDILRQLINKRSELIKIREQINAEGIYTISNTETAKCVLLRKKQISSLISSITNQIEEIKNSISA